MGAGEAKKPCGPSSDPSSKDVVAGQSVDPAYEQFRFWLAQQLPLAEIRDRLAGRHVTGGQLYMEVNARITSMLQALALEAMYAQAADDEGGQG